MITNGSCTVVRPDEEGGAVVYSGECMWQAGFGLQVKGYGEERSDGIAVFIPGIVEIKEGDMIARGSGADILQNGFTVMKVYPRDYGSPAMQHTELEVQ